MNASNAFNLLDRKPWTFEAGLRQHARTRDLVFCWNVCDWSTQLPIVSTTHAVDQGPLSTALVYQQEEDVAAETGVPQALTQGEASICHKCCNALRNCEAKDGQEEALSIKARELTSHGFSTHLHARLSKYVAQLYLKVIGGIDSTRPCATRLKSALSLVLNSPPSNAIAAAAPGRCTWAIVTPSSPRQSPNTDHVALWRHGKLPI